MEDSDMQQAIASIDPYRGPMSGSRRICTAMIYLRGETSSEKDPRDAVDQVRQQRGVVGAEVLNTRAPLVVLRFDRQETAASDIIRVLRRSGFAAVLVGC
jgi:hypothetical protein